MNTKSQKYSFVHIGKELDKIDNIITDINTQVYPGTSFGEPLKGVPTGFPDIDVSISGLQPGLTVIAARPSLYIPDFVNSVIFRNCIRDKKSVLYLSLTPARERITERLLFSSAYVSIGTAYDGLLSEQILDRLKDSRKSLKPLEDRLFIPDKISSFQEFQELCQELKKEKDICLSIIDNFQELVRLNEVSSNLDRAEETARSLEELSHEIQLPILLFSEVNSSCSSPKRKRSSLSITDLKNCEALYNRARPTLLFSIEYQEGEEEVIEDRDALPIIVKIENNINHSLSPIFLTYLSPYGRFESAAKVCLDESCLDEKDKTKRQDIILEDAPNPQIV